MFLCETEGGEGVMCLCGIRGTQREKSVLV